MQTKISTKGQVVLPQPIRRQLNLRVGDELDAKVSDGSVVLTPRRKRAKHVRIIKDPVTGFPVLDVGDDAPTLTTKEIEEILSDFP